MSRYLDNFLSTAEAPRTAPAGAVSARRSAFLDNFERSLQVPAPALQPRTLGLAQPLRVSAAPSSIGVETQPVLGPLATVEPYGPSGGFTWKGPQVPYRPPGSVVARVAPPAQEIVPRPEVPVENLHIAELPDTARAIPEAELPFERAERRAATSGVPEIDQNVRRWSKVYKVDPNLVLAVIRAESAQDIRAKSSKGARGLMQLMPDTARGLGVVDSHDLTQNIAGGTQYLSELIKQFGTVERALWAYNAGPKAAAGNNLPNETRRYIRRVLNIKARLDNQSTVAYTAQKPPVSPPATRTLSSLSMPLRQAPRVTPYQPPSDLRDLAPNLTTAFSRGGGMVQRAAGGLLTMAGTLHEPGAQPVGEALLRPVRTLGAEIRAAGQETIEANPPAEQYRLPDAWRGYFTPEFAAKLLDPSFWATNLPDQAVIMAPFMVAAATGAGIPGYVVGNMMFEAGNEFADAKERGASDQDAMKSAGLVMAANVPVSALGVVPGTEVMRRWAAPAIKRKLAAGLLDWAGEAGEEGLQKFAQNVGARLTYAPGQALAEGVGTETLAGALVTGPMKAVGLAATPLRSAPRTLAAEPIAPETPPPVVPQAPTLAPEQRIADAQEREAQAVERRADRAEVKSLADVPEVVTPAPSAPRLPKVGDTIEFEEGFPPRKVSGKVVRIASSPIPGGEPLVPVVDRGGREWPAVEWFESGRIVTSAPEVSAPQPEVPAEGAEPGQRTEKLGVRREGKEPESFSPWQLPLEEWMAWEAQAFGDEPGPITEQNRGWHRGHVLAAIADGKIVPPEVLAEYQDLAKEAPAREGRPEAPAAAPEAVAPAEAPPAAPAAPARAEGGAVDYASAPIERVVFDAGRGTEEQKKAAIVALRQRKAEYDAFNERPHAERVKALKAMVEGEKAAEPVKAEKPKKSAPKVYGGTYYFPTHADAQSWAETNRWPTERIISYERGWAVQKEAGGAYAGPNEPAQGAKEPAPETPKAVKSPERLTGAKAVAQRIVNAENSFIDFAMETAGLTRPQAEEALKSYKKSKAVKIDAVGGQFNLTRGEFAEPDVLRRAAGVEAAEPAPAEPEVPAGENYKDHIIRREQATQVGYKGPLEKGKQTRKANGFLVTEPDGHERFFDTKREAVAWIDANAQPVAEPAPAAPEREPWQMTREEYGWVEMYPTGNRWSVHGPVQAVRQVEGGGAAEYFTKSEMAQKYIVTKHRQAVKAALAASKPVPASVLADYPDLKPAAKAAPKSDVEAEAKRSRPSERIVFDKPFVGPSGASLVSYEWKWEPMEYVDKRGEDRVKKVSNWMEAEPSGETGRQLVHQFAVKTPDGETRVVSAETVPQLLGYTPAEASERLPSLVSTVKTLAKNRMERDRVEQRIADHKKAWDEVQALPLPEIEKAEITPKRPVKGASKSIPVLRMGNAEQWLTGSISEAEARKQLPGVWRLKQMDERGFDRPLSVAQADLAAIDKRIAQSEARIKAVSESAAKAAPKEAPAATPDEATSQAKPLTRTQKYKAVEAALVEQEKLSEVWRAQAQKAWGGKGIPVGAPDIEYLWKADAIIEMAKRIRAGQDPKYAAEKVKEEVRTWIAKHNSRRPTDINWRRWDGSADAAVDGVVRAVAFAKKPAATPEPAAEPVAAEPKAEAKEEAKPQPAAAKVEPTENPAMDRAQENANEVRSAIDTVKDIKDAVRLVKRLQFEHEWAVSDMRNKWKNKNDVEALRRRIGSMVANEDEAIAAMRIRQPDFVLPATAEPPAEADYILRPPMPDEEQAAIKAMKGKKQTITISRDGGTKEQVKATVFGPFALNTTRGHTAITHIPTGFGIGKGQHGGLWTQPDAKRFIYKLLQADIDWNAIKSKADYTATIEDKVSAVFSSMDLRTEEFPEGEDLVFGLGAYYQLYNRLPAIAKADPDFLKNPVFTIASVEGDTKQGYRVVLEWQSQKPKEGGPRFYRIPFGQWLGGEGATIPKAGETVRISLNLLEKAGLSPEQIKQADIRNPKGALNRLLGEARSTELRFADTFLADAAEKLGKKVGGLLKSSKPTVDADKHPDLADLREQRQTAEELYKTYEKGIRRAVDPESFAESVFQEFEGVRVLKVAALETLTNDLEALTVFTNLVEKVSGKKFGVLEHFGKRAELLRQKEGAAEVLSETWANIILGIGGEGAQRWGLSKKDLEGFEDFIQAKSFIRREEILIDRPLPEDAKRLWRLAQLQEAYRSGKRLVPGQRELALSKRREATLRKRVDATPKPIPGLKGDLTFWKWLKHQGTKRTEYAEMEKDAQRTLHLDFGRFKRSMMAREGLEGRLAEEKATQTAMQEKGRRFLDRLKQREEKIRAKRRKPEDLNPGGKTADDARRMLAQLEEVVGIPTFQKYEKAAAVLGHFWRVQLKYVRDSGLIADDTYQAILADNLEHGDYLGPFDIIRHAAQNMGRPQNLPKSLSVYDQDVVKAMIGTTSLNDNLLQASVKKLYHMVQLAERNKVIQTLYRYRSIPGVETAIVDLKEGQDVPEGFSKVHFYLDGELKAIGLPIPVAEAMTGMDKASTDWVVKALAYSSNWLRMGATSLAPSFFIRNPFRDYWTQAVKAEHPLIIGKPEDMAIMTDAFLTAVVGRNQKLYDQWRKAGGAYSGRLAQFRRGHAKAERLLQGDHGNLLTVNPAKLLNALAAGTMDVMGSTEEATRLAVFEKEKRHQVKLRGEDIDNPSEESLAEAGYASLTATINFRNHGRFFRTLRLLAPFTSARIQGFRTNVQGVRAHPMRAGLIAFGGAAVAVAVMMRNRDDYDDLLDKIPPYKRRDNWIIIVGEFADEDGERRPKYFTIPKGDFISTITAPVEDYLTWIYTNHKDVWATLKDTVEQASPVQIKSWGGAIAQFLPPGLKGALQATANYDFYRERPIVSERLKEREPQDRYYPWTSVGAREIGDKLGVAPAHVESFVRDITGEFGSIVLRTPEYLGNVPADSRRMAEVERLASVPMIRGLFSTQTTREQEPFHDALTRVEEKHGSQRFKNKQEHAKALQSWDKWTAAQQVGYTKALPVEDRGPFLNLVKNMPRGAENESVYRRLRTMGVNDGERADGIIALLNEVRAPEARAMMIQAFVAHQIVNLVVWEQLHARASAIRQPITFDEYKREAGKVAAQR